jgi:hypothetical protein
MGARTIPDGAAVTNHFSCSFPPWALEVAATSVSGIGDETEVIDGPDGRGYATGKASRRDLTIVVPSHDPSARGLHLWKIACEHGTPGYQVVGLVTVADVADNVVAVYELSNCICKQFEQNDMSLDSAEIGLITFTISYARATRIT